MHIIMVSGTYYVLVVGLSLSLRSFHLFSLLFPSTAALPVRTYHLCLQLPLPQPSLFTHYGNTFPTGGVAGGVGGMWVCGVDGGVGGMWSVRMVEWARCGRGAVPGPVAGEGSIFPWRIESSVDFFLSSGTGMVTGQP